MMINKDLHNCFVEESYMKNQIIKEIPEFTPEIREAINRDKFAVFIGAGVSRLVGCKGWAELGKELIEECFNINSIDFKEKEMLLRESNNKKIITICYGILEEKDKKETFFSIMRKALKPEKNNGTNDELISPIYDDLYKLKAVYLTTNADLIFDKKFRYPPTYTYDGTTINNIHIGNLYKLHGTMDDETSLVFTVEQYIKTYREVPFRNFLTKIFHEYTVLFIGYGLEEFELLEYIIMSNNNDSNSLRHFILNPYYKEDTRSLEFDQKYYNAMGIQVIPYSKNFLGFNQLDRVIAYWAKKINSETGVLYQTFTEIDTIIAAKNEASIKILLDNIHHDVPRERYFLGEIANSDQATFWFETLYKQDYYQDSNSPLLNIKVIDVAIKFLERVIRDEEFLHNSAIARHMDDLIEELKRQNNIIPELNENLIKLKFMMPIQQVINQEWIPYIISVIQKSSSKYSGWDILENTVFPALLKNIETDFLCKLIMSILDYRSKQNIDNEDDYSFKKLALKFKFAIFKIYEEECMKVMVFLINRIIKTERFSFDRYQVPNLDDLQALIYADCFPITLLECLRDFLLWKKPSVDEAKKTLLNSEYDIYKRLTVYIIDQDYTALKNVLWQCSKNPLTETAVEGELKQLLKKHQKEFLQTEKEKLEFWIQEIDCVEPKATETKRTMWRKILSEGQVELVENGEAKRIVLKKEIMDAENEEIVKKLVSLIEKNTLPEVKAFIQILCQSIHEKPEKFSEGICKFNDIPIEYKADIIASFNEPLSKNMVFDFASVLEFYYKTVESSTFWQEDTDERKAYKFNDWALGNICGFLSNFLYREVSVKNYSDKIFEIIDILYKHQQDIKCPRKPYKWYDLDGYVLNSFEGNMISLMLRYTAEVKGTDEKHSWDSYLKNICETYISSNEEEKIEFFYLMGKYYNEIYSLDKEWISDHTEKLFKSNSKKYIALQGYFCNPNVDPEVYKTLKEKNIYTEALKIDFHNQTIQDNIIKHIVYAYFNDIDQLDVADSLIEELISKGNDSQLDTMITFLWWQRAQISEQNKKYIFQLWKKLYEKFTGEEVEEKEETYKNAISSLGSWIYFVDKLGEAEVQYLNLSLPQLINRNYEDIETKLFEMVDDYPQQASQLYLQLIKTAVFHGSKYEPDIYKMVRVLYEKAEKENADQICQVYSDKGFLFLRDLYKQHNNMTNG